MMQFGEVGRFLKSRFLVDTSKAFLCRVARFALIGVPVMAAQWRLRLLRGPYRYAVRDVWGNEMLLSTADSGIGTDLLFWGKREPLICSRFREMLREGMVVCDIGANIGYYALQEAQLVGKSGVVYAIEPISENRRILGINIAMNGYTNVEVSPLAMGAERGMREIKISGMSNLSTLLDVDGYREYQGTMPVKVETVDSFIAGREDPDVIRMDTEGYEVSIVEGMVNLLRRGKPSILFIEIHFDMLRERVRPMLRTLKEYGYEVACAAFETHPAVQNSVLMPIIAWLENGMGATGYMDVTIDDLMGKECFLSGQVENLEVIFVRRGYGR